MKNAKGDDFTKVNFRRQQLQDDLDIRREDIMQAIEETMEQLERLQDLLEENTDDVHVNGLFKKQQESAKETGKISSPENIKKVIDEFYEDDWEKAGIIGVDAGLCWIGDPCYFMEMTSELPAKDWNMSLAIVQQSLNPNCKGTAQFKYKKGHDGLGVCIRGFGGDRTYPVYIKRGKDGLVKEVKVVFSEHEFSGLYGEQESE